MNETVHLAVVEDQRFTREMTIDLIQDHYGGRVRVAGFAHVEELLATAVERFALVVLDLQLRGGLLQGRDAVGAVALRTRVLVFSALESGEALTRAKAAGAIGYVGKETARARTLIDAIDAGLSGRAFVDPELLARIGASARKQLTARQQDVLRLEALGNKLGQIALKLGLTEAGVRRHIERIVEIHDDCTKQPDRARLAVDLGLVTPWETSQRFGDPNV